MKSFPKVVLTGLHPSYLATPSTPRAMTRPKKEAYNLALRYTDFDFQTKFGSSFGAEANREQMESKYQPKLVCAFCCIQCVGRTWRTEGSLSEGFCAEKVSARALLKILAQSKHRISVTQYLLGICVNMVDAHKVRNLWVFALAKFYRICDVCIKLNDRHLGCCQLLGRKLGSVGRTFSVVPGLGNWSFLVDFFI